MSAPRLRRSHPVARRVLATGAVGLLLALGAVGCGQAPTVPLHQGTVSNADVAPSEPEPAPLVEDLAARSRGWFTDSRGRAASAALRRGDAEAAALSLRAVMDDPAVTAEERAGAVLLLALEDLDAGRYAAAREGFAVARGAPVFGPIVARVMLWEAESALRGDAPEAARALLDAGGDVPASLASKRALLWARAVQRTQPPEAAIEAWEAFLAAHPEDEARFEVRTALAALQRERDPARARALYEEVALAVPLSTYARSSRSELKALLANPKSGSSKKSRRAFERAAAVAALEARLSRRRYKSVVSTAETLLRDKGLDDAQRCRVLYAKARAIFRQRKRAEARRPFDAANRACEAATDWDRVVKSRYQSARGRYAAGEYEKAGRAFEALAAAFPEHTYADDALLLAGESWTSANDTTRAEAAWQEALRAHPTGDMHAEILRRLMLASLTGDAPTKVLALIDTALVDAPDGAAETAKLWYFRGRALGMLDAHADATDAYVRAVEVAPLSYPSLQSLSRLRAQGPEMLARGLAALRPAAAEGAPSPIAQPATNVPEAARIFARLGLGEETARVLEEAEIRGWDKVTLLAQAGLFRASQRTLASMPSTWRAVPPGPENATRWALAHPRPFREIIEAREARIDIAPLLAYAVMQTESRFDPGAVSWAGARGLVQLMPATAKDLAARANLTLSPGDVHDPEINLELGMRYLARLTARFGGGPGAEALAVPSYNAGAGAVDRWLAARGEMPLDLFIESIPYDETRNYVQSVLGRWMAYRWLYAVGTPDDRIPFLPLKTPRKGSPSAP